MTSDQRNQQEPSPWREVLGAENEARDIRERRLKIRCWRRGTKEMDLILGGFFDVEGASLSEEALNEFEALTLEDDAALYRWFSGAESAPQAHAGMIQRIALARAAQTKE